MKRNKFHRIGACAPAGPSILTARNPPRIGYSPGASRFRQSTTRSPRLWMVLMITCVPDRSETAQGQVSQVVGALIIVVAIASAMRIAYTMINDDGRTLRSLMKMSARSCSGRRRCGLSRLS
jgi:hypothetical protein